MYYQINQFMIPTRICNVCNIEKRLNALYFYERININKIDAKIYYDRMCKKCYGKIASEKRKQIRYVLRPSETRMYVRQAIIGSKTEHYFVGENYEYIPPTYEEIKKEYCL